MRASAYFEKPPFASKGGRLSARLGADDFVAYSAHRNLRRKIDEGFSRRVCFRLLYGGVGEGKSWTLSWLLREYHRRKERDDCFVIAIPRLEISRPPQRALVEAALLAVMNADDALISRAAGIKGASPFLRSLSRYLDDEESRLTLTGLGASARVSKRPRLPALSLAIANTQRNIMLATFEALRLDGYARVLLLVDELEAPITLNPKRVVSAFSDFLRDIYDSLEEESSEYPAVQFLFAGTEPVLEKFDPRALGRQIDEGGVLHAFLRRTDPPLYLDPPSEDEVLEIAKQQIEHHRIKDGKDYIPYDENSLRAAWIRAAKNLGDFSKLLRKMYDVADAKKATEIGMEHLELASKELLMITE